MAESAPLLLRSARAAAGLSQRALAARAGTAQSVVARIELGVTSPSVETLARLVGAAGFDLDLGFRASAVIDPTMLDDVPRILALSPEDRPREVGNVNRFVAAARGQRCYTGGAPMEPGAMAASELVVHTDPDILGGKPVFRGTRVPFQALLDYLEGGHTLDAFLNDFPSVSREQAVGALEQAKELLVAGARSAR